MAHFKLLKYLTPGDVGRVAGVSAPAVMAMARRGRLPVAGMTAGGVHLFTLETAERYAAERAARRSRRERTA